MLIEDFQHQPNLKQAQSSLEQFLATVQEEQFQRDRSLMFMESYQQQLNLALLQSLLEQFWAAVQEEQ